MRYRNRYAPLKSAILDWKQWVVSNDEWIIISQKITHAHPELADSAVVGLKFNGFPKRKAMNESCA